jgi:hypothetical protein
MLALPWNSRIKPMRSTAQVLPCPAARHAAQWYAHRVTWRGALPAAPFCGGFMACTGARRQPLHFGFFPRNFAGQANSALQPAHIQRGHAAVWQFSKFATERLDQGSTNSLLWWASRTAELYLKHATAVAELPFKPRLKGSSATAVASNTQCSRLQQCSGEKLWA